MTHMRTHTHTCDIQQTRTNTYTNMEKHKREEKMRYQTAVKQQVTDGHTLEKNMQRITRLYIKTYCIYLHTTKYMVTMEKAENNTGCREDCSLN